MLPSSHAENSQSNTAKTAQTDSNTLPQQTNNNSNNLDNLNNSGQPGETSGQIPNNTEIPDPNTNVDPALQQDSKTWFIQEEYVEVALMKLNNAMKKSGQFASELDWRIRLFGEQ